jgi:hypothetical protein
MNASYSCLANVRAGTTYTKSMSIPTPEGAIAYLSYSYDIGNNISYGDNVQSPAE